jgi:hypothetical protein
VATSGLAHCRDREASRLGEGITTSKDVGFPPDFIGAHSFPHLASFLSRLWSLLCSSHSNFSGGWFSSPFRPHVVDEEWPLSGRSSATLRMDPKNRNPN